RGGVMMGAAIATIVMTTAIGGGASSGSGTQFAAPSQPAQPAPGQPTPAQLAPANPQVTKGEFTGSTVYPGTWREYWVYIPKQLDRTKPAPVMVFQDGLQYNAPN